MSNGVSRELTWIVTSLWVALFLGWITEQWIWVLVGYLVFYITRQLFSMVRFEQWMRGSAKVPYPPTSGLWGELGYLVSYKQRLLQKHADMQLAKSEQFLAASMVVPDAIISIDGDHQIEWFNASAKKLFKLKQSDTGRKLETLLRHPDFIQYLKTFQPRKGLILTTLKGNSRAYQLRLFRYFEDHSLLIVKDIHELYSLAQIRRDFIANASHELRTPLTVLNGYIEVMQDSLTEMSLWTKPLKQMAQQSHRMRSIIDDLLTLSAMESETLTEKPQKVRIAEVLQMLQQDVAQMSQDNHQFVFNIDTNLVIKGYLEPLKSVLTNLVSNAVRYTPDGGKIEVNWYQDEKGAHFKVTDTGIGIASEHLSRLTERFYRVDTARSRDTGGTGLGLAIVKHVLERHQAKLYVSSQLGKGSTFRCDFPKSIVVSDLIKPS
ncbi:phosphate regulon sensor histidine kinase PhoR [Hydrogenovibrio sp. SC-1]|uniref:phosphate regulon sensor histidine kinase PhoR n=1 Tax=Hydrogenovibrio sp. SC-1 TaxID=2065820 RepID=UPI000C7C6935|nr:phosphate regulon sensor histidine kinase PhoR [Hydrogenovibrio sp. SC-1]PLA75100.1 phosphate regulon sensor histidine kinase PhoR [Hydrogenovibrio sp. SC-1]